MVGIIPRLDGYSMMGQSITWGSFFAPRTKLLFAAASMNIPSSVSRSRFLHSAKVSLFTLKRNSTVYVLSGLEIFVSI